MKLLIRLLRKYGVSRLILVFTLFTIVSAILLTKLILIVLYQNYSNITLPIPALVAGILTPLIGGRILWLVEQLDKTEQQLRIQANTDALTGVYNRHYFFQQIAQLQSNPGDQIAIMVLDIDLFKQTNDQYGHLAGDQALSKLANACCALLSKGDIIARFGGDEFIILLHNTNRTQATRLTRQVLQAVNSIAIWQEEKKISISASIGVAIGYLNQQSLKELIGAADEALYQAKHAGGGQFRLADDATSGANSVPPTPA